MKVKTLLVVLLLANLTSCNLTSDLSLQSNSQDNIEELIDVKTQIVDTQIELDNHIIDSYSEYISDGLLEHGYIYQCYDEKFFENKSLILTSLQASSGSYRYKCKGIDIKDNQIDVYINSYSPEMATDDIKEWTLLIEVDSSLINKEYSINNIVSSSNQRLDSMSMKAQYDYNTMFNSNNNPVARLLLDYSDIFFKSNDYYLDEILAGDIVNVFFVGEAYILESYPSRVQIEEIISIEVIKANVIAIDIHPVPGGNDEYDLVTNEDVRIDYKQGTPNKIIIDKDNNFKSFDVNDDSLLKQYETIYATTTFVENNMHKIEAFYTFDPSK